MKDIYCKSIKLNYLILNCYENNCYYVWKIKNKYIYTINICLFIYINISILKFQNEHKKL